MVHSQSMLMEGILNSIPRRDHDHAGARAEQGGQEVVSRCQIAFSAVWQRETRQEGPLPLQFLQSLYRIIIFLHINMSWYHIVLFHRVSKIT